MICPLESASQITERFDHVREILHAQHPEWADLPRSDTGFKKARIKSGLSLFPLLWDQLRRERPRLAGTAWRWKSHVLLSVDGTRFKAPRPPKNEAVLKRAGKEKTGPQT